MILCGSQPAPAAPHELDSLALPLLVVPAQQKTGSQQTTGILALVAIWIAVVLTCCLQVEGCSLPPPLTPPTSLCQEAVMQAAAAAPLPLPTCPLAALNCPLPSPLPLIPCPLWQARYASSYPCWAEAYFDPHYCCWPQNTFFLLVMTQGDAIRLSLLRVVCCRHSPFCSSY